MCEILGHLGLKWNFLVAIAERCAISIPGSNSGKGILLLNSFKNSASKQLQFDPRWYQCNNKHAYDAFGTGFHFSCVTDYVVNFNVELRNESQPDIHR